MNWCTIPRTESQGVVNSPVQRKEEESSSESYCGWPALSSPAALQAYRTTYFSEDVRMTSTVPIHMCRSYTTHGIYFDVFIFSTRGVWSSAAQTCGEGMCSANKVAHQKLLWVTVIRREPQICQSARQWVIKPCWHSKWVDKRLISLIPSLFVSVNLSQYTVCVCWCMCVCIHMSGSLLIFAVHLIA